MNKILSKTLNNFRLYRWLKQLKLQKSITDRAVSQYKTAIEYIYKQNIHAITAFNPPITVPLVISLTSYGKRLHQVHHVISSLLNQTYQAEKVILWVSDDELEIAKSNNHLSLLTHYGLEIRGTKDIRSYKKLIPSISLYPDKPIVTVDDDVVYQPDLIQKLYEEHQKYPNCIVAGRAHKVTFESNNQVKKYTDWDFDANYDHPRFDLVPIGIGGVLYPVGALFSDVCNEELFAKLAPTCDDLWFKVMSILNNAKVKNVDTPTPYKYYLHLPEAETSLWQQNYWKNDEQFKALMKHYPKLERLFAQP